MPFPTNSDPAHSTGTYTGAIPNESRTANTTVLTLTAFAATILATLAAHWIAKQYFPAHQALITRVAGLVSAAALVSAMAFFQRQASAISAPAAFQDAQGRTTPQGMHRKVRSAIYLSLYAAIIVVLMLQPLPLRTRTAIFRAQFGVVLLWSWGVRGIKRHIYVLGNRGQYDRALRLDRFWSATPLYGSPLAGSILFNAGRYREAQAWLKPLAFDAQGNPRLTSVALYTYALALVNDDRTAEAQGLLEAAAQASPNPGPLQVALATCLLSQGKDPRRACSLMETAMAGPQKDASTYLVRADQARRIGRYAWALAAAGRRNEAQAKIDEALAMGSDLRPEDAAGVQYFVGEAWRALNDKVKAKAAFDQAITLRPDGVTALSVRKAMAKMAALSS
jgi:tetratricopeptide (TPR) repeat protein